MSSLIVVAMETHLDGGHKWLYIKARKGAKLYLRQGSDLSASGLAIDMIN